jgi:hypothetical protein
MVGVCDYVWSGPPILLIGVDFGGSQSQKRKNTPGIKGEAILTAIDFKIMILARQSEEVV